MDVLVQLQLIRTQRSHTVRTMTPRDDSLGRVLQGRKRLVAAQGEQRFGRSEFFLIARGTQWDMINEAVAGAPYEAELISFAPALLERFQQRFGQFAPLSAVPGCAATPADESFTRSFEHACAALRDPESSLAVREHRGLELLLLLAERGLVFAPPREMAWVERVQRLVGQRPHVAWSVERVADAFHLSASTLQRRLAEEGTALARCVREVRLEVAMALLQQGAGLQVSEIAARCGYDSHSRFSAAFKQRYGFAPSELR